MGLVANFIGIATQPRFSKSVLEEDLSSSSAEQFSRAEQSMSAQPAQLGSSAEQLLQSGSAEQLSTTPQLRLSVLSRPVTGARSSGLARCGLARRLDRRRSRGLARGDSLEGACSLQQTNLVDRRFGGENVEPEPGNHVSCLCLHCVHACVRACV